MDLSERLSNLMSEKITPFVKSGECSDEVSLCFDDGRKLYISRNFLCYASPVFKTMFQMKEPDEKEVVMSGAVYGDFLELLLCLHPGVQKQIDCTNVLRIVSLAKEYQIQSFENRCQKAMIKWLSSEVDSACSKDGDIKKVQNAKTCLNVLIKAIALEYEDVVTHAIEVLARFGFDVFTGVMTKPAFKFGESNFSKAPPVSLAFGKKDEKPEIKYTNDKSFNFFTPAPTNSGTEDSMDACKELYDSLSEDIKTRLLLQRLKLCDDCFMRKVLSDGKSIVVNQSSK